MPLLKISGFDGVVPRESPTMLGDSQAQTANNVKLYSKELRYWRGPTLEFTPAITGIKSIYKYYAGASTAYWLTWTTDVNVSPGPSADTTDYRLYYTGDGTPKKTNLALATAAGTGAYPRSSLPMGVPAPAAAPVATRNGTGTSNPEDRVYVYTYVSTFGSVQEESAPSPPSTDVVIYTGDTCDINGFTAPPGGYNITTMRIYRSVTGSTTASYLFVAEVPIATILYNDAIAVSSLGAAIGTIGWLPPPDTLAGLLPHPSGSLVGFSGNTIYFSQPYYPHAWPLIYALNVPYPIVGIGIFGTSVVVATERYPYIIDGYTPGSMTVQRVPILEPCVSKQSIASDEYGVTYASPNGLVGIGPTSRQVTTDSLFRRDEWQAINPDQIAGAVVDSKYFAVFPTSATNEKTMVISRNDVPALSFLSLNATAIYVDSRTAKLYYVNALDSLIYQVDADANNPLQYEWLSKRFVMPQATTWSALKLDGDFGAITDSAAYAALYAAVAAANQALFSSPLQGALGATYLNRFDVNGSILTNLPKPGTIRSVQVFLYADGVLAAQFNLSSFDPVRIPPFKSRTIEVKITGTLNVRSIALATTVPELHQ